MSPPEKKPPTAEEGKASDGRPSLQEREDLPDLIVKLHERRERHKERSRVYRSGVVAAGIVLIVVGIVLSGPGIPGPGFVVILVGLALLALEFTWAERLLERAVIAGDRLKDRAEAMSTRQKVALGAVAALVVAACVVAAVLWDIPLLPV